MVLSLPLERRSMRMSPRSRLSLISLILLAFCLATGFAVAADKPHYLITNDDVPPTFENSVTFYAIGTNGQLTMQTRATISEGGIGGGYFAANRIDVLDKGNAQCVYASVAATGQIEGISIATLEVTGSANGSKDDTGASNGVGLAINSKYLYASFTDSSNIGTFRVLSGCKLKFISDITVAGLQGGFVDGMLIHGDIMVVTYGDGSIQSFNISAGVPVSNDDEQNSTGSPPRHTFLPPREFIPDSNTTHFFVTS